MAMSARGSLLADSVSTTATTSPTGALGTVYVPSPRMFPLIDLFGSAGSIRRTLPPASAKVVGILARKCRGRASAYGSW